MLLNPFSVVPMESALFTRAALVNCTESRKPEYLSTALPGNEEYYAGIITCTGIESTQNYRCSFTEKQSKQTPGLKRLYLLAAQCTGKLAMRKTLLVTGKPHKSFNFIPATKKIDSDELQIIVSDVPQPVSFVQRNSNGSPGAPPGTCAKTWERERDYDSMIAGYCGYLASCDINENIDYARESMRRAQPEWPRGRCPEP